MALENFGAYGRDSLVLGIAPILTSTAGTGEVSEGVPIYHGFSSDPGFTLTFALTPEHTTERCRAVVVNLRYRQRPCDFARLAQYL